MGLSCSQLKPCFYIIFQSHSVFSSTIKNIPLLVLSRGILLTFEKITKFDENNLKIILNNSKSGGGELWHFQNVSSTVVDFQMLALKNPFQNHKPIIYCTVSWKQNEYKL